MRINFKCTECGETSWFEVNEDYIVKEEDLYCDDCIEDEEDE